MKQESSEEKTGEVLTLALNRDAALHGRALLLLWFFQSIFDPHIYAACPSVLTLWPPTHIPIMPPPWRARAAFNAALSKYVRSDQR